MSYIVYTVIFLGFVNFGVGINKKAYVHIKACTWNFIAILFIIAKKKKHPNVYQLMNK